MGQKVNPTSFRIGSTFSWKSRWFANPSDYSDRVVEDYTVRKFLNDKLISAGVTNVEIERSLKAIKVILFVSRPGVVIGKGGANLEVIKKEIERILNVSKLQKDKVKIDLRVEEVRKPDLSSKLVAERIVNQLIKRFPHRRAVMQALEKTMQAGAKGIKIQLSGRINGAEIGRTEKYFQGSVPTQTIRANIDYFQVPARTRSGYVGIKVWIYKGELV
ncbi:30S ribosomal protein S3 [Patescibacteria group bacterium]|nr:30S ribosomal protein S3 [Patescibacteria group bacterium]